MQAIHLAAQTGDPEVADLLIQADDAVINIATSCEDRYTPLHLAAGNGHAAMTSFLLQAGARVSAGNAQFVTPLHSVMTSSSSAATAVVVEILAFLEQQDDDMLALGATLDLEDCYGRTPLHFASSSGKLRYICCQAQGRPGCDCYIHKMNTF